MHKVTQVTPEIEPALRAGWEPPGFLPHGQQALEKALQNSLCIHPALTQAPPLRRLLLRAAMCQGLQGSCLPHSRPGAFVPRVTGCRLSAGSAPGGEGGLCARGSPSDGQDPGYHLASLVPG